MSKLQKFFSKKWFLIVVPILYLFAAIGYNVTVMLENVREGMYYLCGDILIEILIIVICITYKKHNKNVMKAVVGGLLLYICAIDINWAMSSSLYGGEISDIIFAWVLTVLSITFYIGHLLLAKDHKSNAFAVKLNLFVGVLYAIASIAWGVFEIVVIGIPVLYGICFSVLRICEIAIVMNIESKIDYFKQIRDAKAQEQTE